MSLSEIRQRFSAFGYGIYLYTNDPLWGRVKYRTAPLASGGTHGLFRTKRELISYLEQIETTRRIDNDD